VNTSQNQGPEDMSIEQCQFDKEEELHHWVEQNIGTFLGEGIFLDGFYIYTKRKKGGVPDGFFLDLHNQTWTIIESELIYHGVWDHIAEQIVRFIVASQNSDTQRKIRNEFFNKIENDGTIQQYAAKVGVEPHRLMENIETIIEGSPPEIAIFIDEVNEDLKDMAEALNATVKIFRIQKYKADGKVHFLSPDQAKTIFETSSEETRDAIGRPLTVINSLGGGRIVDSIGQVKIYELNSGERVAVKYSREYPDGGFWFSIRPNLMNIYREGKVTSLIFALGDGGLAKVPLSVVDEYLKEANASYGPDGSIKWYYVHIKRVPDLSMHRTRTGRAWNIEQYYSALD
jgi:hypothetical protein